MIELLQQSPTAYLILTIILGLIVGSFINVVVYRLPIMLLHEWQSECQIWLNIQSSSAPFVAPNKPFNLLLPGSHCPHCQHSLSAWENIPILSYLWLKGRCSHCKAPISMRYLMVELFTAVTSTLVVWQLGFSIQTVAALLLTWTLITLSFIDLEKQLLPDNITFPTLWLGLLLSLWGIFVTPNEAILGAVVGYLSLWSIYWIFKLLTKKEGMGYGDFKLLALFGAWLGWQSLLGIILIASLLGAIIGIALIGTSKLARDNPMPFGPFLAFGGWVMLLWGKQITALLY